MNHADTLPFLDLPAMHAPIMPEIRRAIDRVIDAHAFALGYAVQEFEENFAQFCGVSHCVGLNSGTSAVHLALLCAGVRAGDEVITTPYTWISTSWAISYLGAKPVYVDIDPVTYCLDPAKIEAAITPQTRAILPVDLYGHPADMDAIMEIGRRHGLAVVEDAAQAHGALYKGRRCGSLGDVAAFSFYPGKNLGAFGEGGAVLTDNPEWAQRVRALRDHAQEGRHNHLELGFNYRMEGLQAAVLGVKLSHVEDWNEQRRQVAEKYGASLAGVAGLRLPAAASWATPVWHIFALQHPRRDALRHHLQECRIQTGVHYPRAIHQQPAYAHLGYSEGSLPEAEGIARQQLSLPIFPNMTDAQVQRVTDSIRGFCS